MTRRYSFIDRNGSPGAIQFTIHRVREVGFRARFDAVHAEILRTLAANGCTQIKRVRPKRRGEPRGNVTMIEL